MKKSITVKLKIDATHMHLTSETDGCNVEWGGSYHFNGSLRGEYDILITDNGIKTLTGSFSPKKAK